MSKKPGKNGDPVLLKAIADGDLPTVQARIADGADLNAAPKNEDPPLFAAIRGNHQDILRALIKAGADINNVTRPNGSSLNSTPLCFAIDQKNWALAQMLVQAGADLAREPYPGENAAGFAAQCATKQFFLANASDEEWLSSKIRTEAIREKARHDCANWMQFVRDAIAKGIKVRDYWLWNAIAHHHDELALLLISSGVNPNAAPHGGSALVRAIENGRDDVVRALITAGADVNKSASSAPLLAAAEKGRLAIIPDLLKAGANINVAENVTLVGPDKNAYNHPVAEASTALIVATRRGNLELVKLLIAHSADVNLVDKHGVNALAWAQRTGRKDIAALLKKADAAEPEHLEGSTATALWTAAAKGDLAQVQQLLQRGAKPDELVQDREGKHFALVSAAQAGHLEVVQMLIQNGANINIGATEKWSGNFTALMAASRHGHLTTVKALLAAGADVTLKDYGLGDGGEIALHYAARGNNVEIIQALLAAGSKVNAKAKGSLTPLRIAVENKNLEAAKALLNAGADPNAGPADGNGPLYAAVSQGNLELVKLLLDHGATPDPRAKNASSFPLHRAARDGNIELIRLLLQAGASVNAPGHEGSTALSGAAVYGREEAVKILLAASADPNLAEANGFTPLMAAVRSKKIPVVNLILNAGAYVHAAQNSGLTVLDIAREGRQQDIINLLEAAAAKQPAPKVTAKKATAPKPVEDDEEELESPNFSEAAAKPKFQAALREVEKLCGTKATPLGDVAGGYSFNVSADDIKKLLTAHHERLLKSGAYLFRHADDKLGLLPTADWADVIRAQQTNGANYDLMPEDIIKWLQKLATEQPLLLTGAGWDWLEGRFTTPIQQSRKLAKQMIDFCPDIGEDMGAEKKLAKLLEKDRTFFFWWD